MTKEEAVSKVLDIARVEIGYHESGENLTKYASAYDYDNRLYGFEMSGQPWCDYFVDWLFMKTFGFEIGSSMTYQYSGCAGAACAQSASYYQLHGAFYSDPEIGDQIFFYVSGGINHTGIVEKIENGYVTTIEGNSSDRVRRNVYRLIDQSIAGYGRPAWRYVTDRKEDCPEYLMEEKKLEFTADLNVDGEFGRLTEEAVREFQKAFELEKDGIVGSLTWGKIFEIISKELLRKGSEGWLVIALQALMNHIGGEK